MILHAYTQSTLQTRNKVQEVVSVTIPLTKLQEPHIFENVTRITIVDDVSDEPGIMAEFHDVGYMCLHYAPRQSLR